MSCCRVIKDMLTVKARPRKTHGRGRERVAPDAKAIQFSRWIWIHIIVFFKKITTKQKRAQPLIAKEAIYNHLIIFSAFLCSDTRSDFCSLPTNCTSKITQAHPHEQVHDEQPALAHPLPHCMADFSTLLKYLWQHLHASFFVTGLRSS